MAEDNFHLRWPTEYVGEITQKFGVNPQNYARFGLPGHEGVDFKAPLRSSIYACYAGTIYQIRYASDGGPYGNHIRMFHDGTPYKTLYAHLSEIYVKLGEKITEGQLIGLAGNTGNSHGSHLHLTLFQNDATANGLTSYPRDIIDPTPFLVTKFPIAGVKLTTIATRGQFIREGAGVNHYVLTAIYPGQIVVSVEEGDSVDKKLNSVSESHHEWIRIITLNGVEGYCVAMYLRKINDNS